MMPNDMPIITLTLTNLHENYTRWDESHITRFNFIDWYTAPNIIASDASVIKQYCSYN